MRLASSSFREGDLIPVRYTCDGENISPQLEWNEAPDSTRSFTLICDDPDAPSGTWVHWIIINIPAGIRTLAENYRVSGGPLNCTNSWGRTGYGGPCPPGGVHRYFFKLYALDCELNLTSASRKADIEKAMNGHLLAEAHTMGRYKRIR